METTQTSLSPDELVAAVDDVVFNPVTGAFITDDFVVVKRERYERLATAESLLNDFRFAKSAPGLDERKARRAAAYAAADNYFNLR